MHWIVCGLFAFALSTAVAAQGTEAFASQLLNRKVCGDVAAELGLVGLHHVNLMRGNHYSARVVTGEWQGVLLVRYAGRSGEDRCWTVHQAIALEGDLSGLESLGGGHCAPPGASIGRAIPHTVALVEPVEDWASPPGCYTVTQAWYLVGSETEEAFLVELEPDGMCCGTPTGC